jgi:hypothetical protein
MICDELGFVPFDRQGGELLFNLGTGQRALVSSSARKP